MLSARFSKTERTTILTERIQGIFSHLFAHVSIRKRSTRNMHYNIHLRWDGRTVAPGRSVFEFADRREHPLLNGERRFSAYDPRVSHPAIQVNSNFHGDVLLKTRWQVAGWN